MENIFKYKDDVKNRWVAKITAGQLYVTTERELITTVLGSCVAVCVWDPITKVSGMNHLMLPIQLNDRLPENNYGDYAIDALLAAFTQAGGQTDRCEVKLFGGSRVIKTVGDVGAENIKYARTHLKQLGISVVAESLGGERPKQIILDPDTGKIRMKELNSDG